MMRIVRPTPAVWSVILLATGLVLDVFFTCGANLVAFAAIAGVTLRARIAAIVSLGVWAESQIVGFTFKGYPHDGMTLAWGVALGVATLLATVVAIELAKRGTLAAFVTAFAVYELALVAFALVARSGLAAFAPGIVLQIGTSNALLALGLLVLYAVAGALEAALARRAGRAA